MNKEEYLSLTEVVKLPVIIKAADLKNQEDRTLLWGYTCDRKSWHLYLLDGKFHFVCYHFAGDLELTERDIITAYIKDEINCDQDPITPDKRLYPEACDGEFCRTLKALDVFMCFTNFNEERTPDQFYGKLLPEELNEKYAA